jgi:catechol 2,3-dioxygenase-like lactoylglutathione lyase family enzyme
MPVSGPGTIAPPPVHSRLLRHLVSTVAHHCWQAADSPPCTPLPSRRPNRRGIDDEQAPEKLPGVTHPGAMPGLGDITSAVASMNHVALHIPVDKFYEYRDRLIAKGVEVGQVLFHDDSPSTVATRMHDGVYVGSLYFLDPDGILLEFAAWTRELTPADVRHTPTAARPTATLDA